VVDHLNYQQLAKLNSNDFRQRKTNHWANPKNQTRGEAYRKLLDKLPEIPLFETGALYSGRHRIPGTASRQSNALTGVFGKCSL